jgi:hypothetical protein
MKIKKIENDVQEDPVPIATVLKLTIYDAWRQNKISKKVYLDYLKDGYPKTQIIDIK